ncbi:MAG: type III-B CRISPR module RAMP protein Cmr6 [Dissulfuribacterales bacterium]
MRLISTNLSDAFVSGQPINFSLYFNKMLSYWDEFNFEVVKFNKKKNTTETTITETLKPKQGDQKKKDEDPLQSPFIQHFPVYQSSHKKAADIIKQRHIHQATYGKAMEKAGWKSFVIHAKLTAPFVSGLGMSHPTETGLVLDHTSGVPYIPASSQKGVLRVAHIIDTLCDENRQWKEIEELLANNIITQDEEKKLSWKEDDASKTIFGFSDKQSALAGQLVVLDAYPLKVPELGEEILNPHFMKYYGGERGPTEDQSPIPVKFLVVKPGAEFVFRVLLRLPFAKALEKDHEKLEEVMKNNLKRAIIEEGMGAKTSLGFGRFSIIREGEPSEIQIWLDEQERQQEQNLYPWRPFLQRIKAANDWGQLKQLMENSALLEYQANKEIAEAFKNVADHIRKNNPKKWDADRDKLVADWLQPSGMSWEAEGSVVGNSMTQEEQSEIEQIQQIKDWGAWKTADIDINKLSSSALNTLKKRFEEWGCNNKKAKKDKIQAWEQLNKALKARS